MVTEFLHWDMRVPVIWLLTLFSNVDLVLTHHRSPVPDTATENGVALVAHNHAEVELPEIGLCFQDDLSNRNKRRTE